MSNTIYASFNDAVLAEKAAGALLDHGVLSQHISLVRNHQGPERIYDGVVEVPAVDPGSGITVGGPGVVSPTGSAGIPNWRSMSGIDEPESSGFGAAPSPGYNQGTSVDEEINREEGEPNMGRLAAAYPSGVASTGGVFPSGLTGEAGYDTAMGTSSPIEPEEVAKYGISTTTPADAGSGALKGTGVGLGVGILAALASLMIPGVGLVVGGGALAIALGGLAASAGAGAAAGAVYGYLKDQGMEEPIARDYSQIVQNGGALLAVQYPSGPVEETEIRQILTKYGVASVGLVGGGDTKGYVA
jgi:hypothetical protein